LRCENLTASQVEASTRETTHPEWKVDVPSGTPLDDSTRDVPLGTSTRDLSTWDGEILAGAVLASWDDNSAVIRFVDEVARGVEPGKPLAYRYAAAISGEARWLPRSEFVVWKRRLLLDGGFVERPVVSLAALPEDASRPARQLWSSIELLVQARLLGGTPAHDPLPLSRRFLRRWVPMGEGSVRTAMEKLQAIRFVTPAGVYEGSNGRRPTKLWRVHLAKEAR